MTATPEHIHRLGEAGGNAAHSGQRYIEFYGWFNPDGSSADALGAVSATDVFGAQSHIPAVSFLSDAQTDLLSGNIGFQIITVALFLIYVFMIFRFGGEIMQYLRLLSGFGNAREQRAENENPSTEVIFGIMLCGLIGFSAALYKILYLWAGNAVAQIIAYAPPLIVIFSAAVAILIILLFQKLLLRLIGSLTFGTKFINILYNLRRSLLITATVTATPLILLLALSQGVWANIFAWALLLTVVLLVIVYIIRSFLLFVGQKVSILFWILYLCAVELMPSAVIVIAIIKYTTG